MTRENWEVVKLGDKIQCNPQTKLQKGEEYDFLPMENIKTGCYKFPVGYEKKINNSGGAKFQNGDTVFARITPCLQNGKICKIQGIEKGFGSTEYFVFRAIKGITDSDYIFYLMCHPYIRDLAEKSMVGASGRQRANVVVIENLEISLPPLAEQQRIASILSAYDDLIENNTRRIALLEQMAQTLYRQWFVEYKFPGYQDVEMVESETEFGMIPSRWEVKKIGDEIAKIKRAKKIQSKEYQTNGSIPIIDQSRGHIAGYTDDEMYLQNSPLPIVVFGDHTRIVKYIPFPFASGADGTQLMYPKNEKMLPNYFYLAILQTEVPNYHYERHYKFLQDKYIIIPSDYALDQFHIHTMPMFDEILNLQKQNQSLKEQRDILLRKLIG